VSTDKLILTCNTPLHLPALLLLLLPVGEAYEANRGEGTLLLLLLLVVFARTCLLFV
jgi:hypothetical protein